MELRQLRYLVTVADEGSFTRAAQRLHVAQPGVSAQIKELERELGEALLDRSGRAVRPTEAGAAVLPYARAALEAADGARQAVSELTGLIRGHVTVGTVASVATIDLPGLLGGFSERHPGVRISLWEGTSDQLLARLRAGRLDLAVVGATSDPGTAGPTGAAPAVPGKADQPAPGVAAQVITDEPVAAAVPPGDPLAARDQVAVADLADRPLICLPPGSGLRASLERACADAGFRPHVAFESSDPRMLLQLAAAGLGVAILSWSAARAAEGDLRAVALAGTTARARLLLAWRDDGGASPAARALIAHARAILPSLAPLRHPGHDA
jgi:DNA-binding transcriptional LysR family regulator